MTPESREGASHAWIVLNHLLSDILIAVRMRGHMLAEVRPKPPPAVASGINRVCLSALFLALCKWVEFCHVPLVGVQKGKVPLEVHGAGKAGGPKAELHERTERALMYGACTGARDELVVTRYGEPSPFLGS